MSTIRTILSALDPMLDYFEWKRPTSPPAASERLTAVQSRWPHAPNALLDLWRLHDGGKWDDLVMFFELLACTAFLRSGERNPEAWPLRDLWLMGTKEALEYDFAGRMGWDEAWVPSLHGDSILGFVTADGALRLDHFKDDQPCVQVDSSFDALVVELAGKLSGGAVRLDEVENAIIVDDRWIWRPESDVEWLPYHSATAP